MASSDIWFPLYVGDYMADTLHLDTRQHGAYFLILCAYYKNRGPLPDNDMFLANIARVTVTDSVTGWSSIRSALEGFFQIRDGKWHHKRADYEIKKRMSAQEARIKAAENTNRIKNTVTASVTDTVSVPKTARLGVANPQSQSESHSESEPEAHYAEAVWDEKTKPGYQGAQELVRYINGRLKTQYRETGITLDLIAERIMEGNGVDVPSCKVMIDRQINCWKGTDFERHLTIATLFKADKFNEYWSARNLPVKRPNQTNQKTMKSDVG